MKKIIKSILSALLILLYAETTLAQSSNYEFHIIYKFMKTRNIAGLKNAMTNGIWIDSPDSNGINSLCHAIYQKDYDGYDLLRNLNADPYPPCLSRMSPKYRNAFFNSKPGYDRYAYLTPLAKKPFLTAKTRTIGTTALMTGLTAGVFAISGSGGGGSDDSGNSGGGDNNDNDSNINVSSDLYFSSHPQNGNPADYLTETVIGGGFLEQMGAQYAYARGYDGRKIYRNFEKSNTAESGYNVEYDTSNDVINVVVYDNGVYSENPKLSPNIIKIKDEEGGGTFGFNFDFGPCTASNNNYCYSFDSTQGKLMLQSGTGTEPQDVGNYTQEQWDEYISHFTSDYVWNVTDSTPHYIDDGNISGHGTHVAGIIGAKPDGGGMQGVAPYVGLIPVTFNPFGSVNTSINILNALFSTYGNIMDSNNQDMQIVNMSFGPQSTETFNALSYANYLEDYDALTTFFTNNHILVAAAGNESQNEPNAISAIPKVVQEAQNLFVSVVAVDSSNNITSYSNKCGSASEWCIAAPGGTIDTPIISTVGPNTIGGMIGTSMAAPTVTGSLSLIMSAFPELTPQQAVEILFKTATDLGDAGVDSVYGHGLVNLNGALAPVGILEIPTDNTTTGTSIALNNSRIFVPENMAGLMDNLPEKFIFLDEYSRAYPLATKSMFTTSDHRDRLENDMKHFVNHTKVNKVAVNDKLSMSFSERVEEPLDDILVGSIAFDYMIDKNTDIGFFFTENTIYQNGDYFSKAISNPFLNMNDAFGIKGSYEFNNYANFDIAIYTGKNGFYNDDKRLRLQNDNQFNAIDYVFNFTPADYITFGFKGGFLQEDGSVLGMNGSGAFATDDSLTTYTGLEIGINPTENLSVTAAYYQGSTKTKSAKSNTLMSLSNIKSESISLDVAYKLNDEDKLGLQIAQPLAFSGGSMLFNLPIGRDPNSDTIYREKYNIALEPEAKELDLGLYFSHETKEDSWFRAELGTRINPDNRNVESDYRIMLGFGAPLN